MHEQTALTAIHKTGRDDGALRNAVALRADTSTAATSLRRHELIHDKRAAALSFFAFINKHPSDVTPLDVTEWHRALKS